MWDDNISHSGWGLKKIFENIPFSKLNITKANDDDDKKLSERLDELVAEMIAAAPPLHLNPQLARRWLLHTPQGQKLLAQHSTMKKDRPMLDIMKVIAITEQGLMATVTKRDGESYAQSFSRKFENDIDFRKQWRDLTEAKHSMAFGKGMATLTPTSTEVGNTSVSDDSMEAVRLLQEMATKQGRKFEEVFADPNNKALAGRTYTSAHRPNSSSTSGDELER